MPAEKRDAPQVGHNTPLQSTATAALHRHIPRPQRSFYGRPPGTGVPIPTRPGYYRRFTAKARADTYWVAKSWNTAANDQAAPSYQTTDLKLLVNRDNWMLSAYVRNVADEVVVYVFNQGGYRFGRPRTIGVQVNYRM